MKTVCCSLAVVLATVALAFATPALAAKPILIGISKIVSHPALDAIEKGIQEVVLADYPDARFDLQNANGEMSTASSIAQKFKAENVTLAVGIATPTAQALVNTLKNCPVIYSAVTDPVGAGLIRSTKKGEKNVTGISDMTPVKAQIELLNRITPIKTLGHVYCSSEANAVSLAAIARQVCREKGIKFVQFRRGETGRPNHRRPGGRHLHIQRQHGRIGPGRRVQRGQGIPYPGDVRRSQQRRNHTGAGGLGIRLL
jgi:putative ABC transport system substrate-binding protein